MRSWLAALPLVLLLGAAAEASTSLRFCGGETQHSVAEQDRLLQVAAVLRDELEAQGQPAALLSRAGTKLQRFGVRYTHAALSLQANPLAPWAVRQLYFACDERRSRLFDQGLAGFLMGADDAQQGFASLLLLPAEAAEPLAAVALDTAKAQQLLAGEYMANAHPFDLLRQNCNQWLVELMALSWSPADQRSDSSRPAAQATLASWSYAPEPVRYGSAFWRLAAAFVPWVSFDGHPPEDAAQNQLRTSLPPDLEALARQRWPAVRRVELCYTPQRIVLRRDGAPLSEACEPGDGDLVRLF